MKDIHYSKSQVTSWNCVSSVPPYGPPQQCGWDDTDTKPQLSNLFHYNIIMSPHHEEEEEEHEGKAPVVGEILDFDDEPIIEMPGIQTGHGEHCAYGQETQPEANNVHHQSDDDVVSVDESILEIAMFEAVLHQEEHQEEEMHSGHEEEEEEIAPLPVVVTIPTSAVPVKRSMNESAVARPVKRAKKEEESKPAPKLAPVAMTPLAAIAQIETAEAKKSPPLPRRRRPNCLFVNHFGTRLNDKGEAVKVNTVATVKSPEPARISSEESVSVRTKSTGRSSKTSSSKNTPVSLALTATPSGSKIPAVVSIVTPAMKKPIKSSCLEDITMEEDEMAPLQQDQDDFMSNGHLPYVNSLTNQPTSPPTPGMPNAMIMQGMMPGGLPHLNFNRPFPLLQRRAFLNGCHPMAGFGPHGWHASHFPRPGMPYPHNPYAAGQPSTASSSSSSTKSQWKKN